MDDNEKDMSEMLQVFQHDNMIGHYKLDKVSLVMPDGLEFSEVERILNGLKAVSESIRFWLGDLMVYSERNYGEKYAQLVDATDYSYQGLCDMMWVSHNVGPEVRQKELTWSHHREVAKLDKNRQMKYLKQAVDETLSVSELHSLIDEKEKMPSGKLTKLGAYEEALVKISLIDVRSNTNDSFDEKDVYEAIKIAETVLKEYRK